METATFESLTMPGVIALDGLAYLPIDIASRLDRLADIRDGIHSVSAAKQAFIDFVMSEYHHRLEAFDADIATLQVLEAPLQEAITAAVLAKGETVKNGRLMAVFSKARETWDGKILSGMAIVFPEIYKARKIGKPSVSFRAV